MSARVESTHPAASRLVVIALVAASVLLCLPLVAAPFPVMQDLPAQLETAAQLRDLWWGPHALADDFVVQRAPFPNALPIMLLAASMDALPDVDALVLARGFVVLALLAWPAALALLARTLGRPLALVLLALPTTYDLSLGYGFVNFLVGRVGLVVALSLASACGRARTRSRAALCAVALAVVLASLFMVHLMCFAIAIVLVLLFVGVDARAQPHLRRRAVLVGVAVIAGASIAVPWFLHRPATVAGAYAWRPPWSAVASVWADSGDLHAGASDVVPWLIAATTLVATALVLRRRAQGRDGTAHVTPAFAVVVVVLFAFAWGGPIRMPGVSVVAERFVAPACALLCLLPRGALSVRHTRVVVAAMLAATLWQALDVTRHWRAFAREDMAGFDALLARVPPGALLATAFAQPTSSHATHAALWHWPKLHAIRAGGRTDDTFAFRDTTLVTLAPQARARGVVQQAHHRLQPAALRAWDELLVGGASPSLDAQLHLLCSGPRPVLSPVAASGRWRLFRVVRAGLSPSDEAR